MSHFLKKMQSEYQMGIAPIDLQTLYTQLDKVGKTYGSQAQTIQVQNALQDVEKSKHQLEENKRINSTKMPEGNDTQQVKDRKYNNQSGSQKKESSDGNESEEENEEKISKRSIFQDPNLGQHIDVIG